MINNTGDIYFVVDEGEYFELEETTKKTGSLTQWDSLNRKE